MRKYGRLDANQQAIVQALRKAGCSVRSLASVGSGCPDLLCGYRGQNFLLEVKNAKRRHKAENEAPFKFAADWKGQVVIVETLEEALYVVGVSRV